MIPYGFHEGSRSEYLAQYVFASWGTSVAIPHQEDHGIDLHCTLMERMKGNWLPKSPYTVQVKSGFDPLVYEGEAIQWFIRHPLPFFLCVVDKQRARLSIYNTLPRFYVRCRGESIDRIVMVPQPPQKGTRGESFMEDRTDLTSFSLSQPILDYSITELLDPEVREDARQVLESWINHETENLYRVHADLLRVRMPQMWYTNETSEGAAWTEMVAHAGGNEQFESTASQMKESLEWIAAFLCDAGDFEGAAKAAMLYRHVFANDGPANLGTLFALLDHRLGLTHIPEKWFAGVDQLAAMVGSALMPRRDDRQ